MKEHVQECPVNGMPIHMSDLDQYYGRYECQCEILRACEQRVLIAAREAVKALCYQHPLIWPTDEGAMQALDAAIDALRGES